MRNLIAVSLFLSLNSIASKADANCHRFPHCYCPDVRCAKEPATEEFKDFFKNLTSKNNFYLEIDDKKITNRAESAQTI